MTRLDTAVVAVGEVNSVGVDAERVRPAQGRVLQDPHVGAVELRATDPRPQPARPAAVLRPVQHAATERRAWGALAGDG